MGLKEIRERTAREKAAGITRTYPEHKDKVRGTAPQRVARPIPATAKSDCGPCSKGEAQRVRPAASPSPSPSPSPFAGLLNSSMIEYQGRLVMASRVDWTSSRIVLHHVRREGPGEYALDGPATPLNLAHHQATIGQEDPRLFVYRGHLHVGYCGVEVVGGVIRAHQLIAELGEDFRTVKLWAPQYAERQYPMEKNWVHFESGDALHSVYSVGPLHQVLRHCGEGANRVAFCPGPAGGREWEWGHLRGGASPVRGPSGELYHWFHGMKLVAGVPTYTVGLYTFEGSAPFRVRRWCPVPVAMPPERVNREGKRVVFPAGAVAPSSLTGGKWLVSCGWDDAETRVLEFDAAEVEGKLVAVAEGSED